MIKIAERKWALAAQNWIIKQNTRLAVVKSNPGVIRVIYTLSQTIKGIVFAILLIFSGIFWAIQNIYLKFHTYVIEKPVESLKSVFAAITIFTVAVLSVWVFHQVRHPPIIVETIDVPEAIRGEVWLSGDLNRMILREIALVRESVAAERNPVFEAMGEPPSVVISADEHTFDVGKSILQPLRLAFGRQPIVVHTSLTCYQPECRRTSGNDCDEVILPAPSDKKASLTADEFKGNLCLRVLADIEGLGARRQVATRVKLSNATYKWELADAFRKVADQVIMVADPVTAALYHTRRSGGDVVLPSSIRVERAMAHEAANLARNQGLVSRCWGDNLMAQVALNERDYNGALAILEQIGTVSVFGELWDLSAPGTCSYLSNFTQMEIARNVLRSQEDDEDRFDVYPVSKEARANAILRLAEQARGGESHPGPEDMNEAAAMMLGETYVRTIRPLFQDRRMACPFSDATGVPTNAFTGARDEINEPNISAARYVEARIEAWSNGKPRGGDLASHAATRFVRDLGRLRGCEAHAVIEAEMLRKAFPDRSSVADYLGDNLVNLAATERSFKQRKPHLEKALLRYNEALAGTDSETAMAVLVKMAVVKVALLGEDLPSLQKLHRPAKEIIALLEEASERFGHDVYPEAEWDVEYQVLALWAALVDLWAKPTDPEGSDQRHKELSCIVSALGVLDIAPAALANQPGRYPKIGPRIKAIENVLSHWMMNSAKRAATLFDIDDNFRLDEGPAKSGEPGKSTQDDKGQQDGDLVLNAVCEN